MVVVNNINENLVLRERWEEEGGGKEKKIYKQLNNPRSGNFAGTRSSIGLTPDRLLFSNGALSCGA